MPALRTITPADRAELPAILAGYPFRARVFPRATRLVFTARSFDTDARIITTYRLNAAGFRNATGGEFSRHSFNQPHEIFIHARLA